jgi:MOSC domain-containing protein YiiM
MINTSNINKKPQGKVLELFVSQADKQNKIIKNKIILDTYGVQDDKFYGKNQQRSVLIASTKSYKMAKKENIDIVYGDLGENILVDCEIYHLEIGSLVYINDVVLEISQQCTLCKSLSKLHKKLPKLLKNDRGIFAKVIKNGSISTNNNIYISGFGIN